MGRGLFPKRKIAKGATVARMKSPTKLNLRRGEPSWGRIQDERLLESEVTRQGLPHDCIVWQSPTKLIYDEAYDKSLWYMMNHGSGGHANVVMSLVGELKLKLSVLNLSQRLFTPRTPRISGATYSDCQRYPSTISGVPSNNY